MTPKLCFKVLLIYTIVVIPFIIVMNYLELSFSVRLFTYCLIGLGAGLSVDTRK